MREAWGCHKTATVIEPYFPVDTDDNGNEVALNRCPILYVPYSIVYFLRVYDYYTRFQSAPMPAFDDVDPLFMDAIAYLEKWIGISNEEKNSG